MGGVQIDRQAHGVIHGDLREMGEKGAEMTSWTKPKPMLRHERELWIEALLEVAEGDDEILRIAKSLRIAVNERRGKTSRFGIESALELLAALGAWLIENEVRDDR